MRNTKRFLFLSQSTLPEVKTCKVIFNVHYTCIHVCPIPIIHLFEFWHCFPGFCKIVIIQDQAYSTGSACHFVNFKLLERQTACDCFSALACGTEGATGLAVQLSLHRLCSQDVATCCSTASGSLWCWTTAPPSLHHHAWPTKAAAYAYFFQVQSSTYCVLPSITNLAYLATSQMFVLFCFFFMF